MAACSCCRSEAAVPSLIAGRPGRPAGRWPPGGGGPAPAAPGEPLARSRADLVAEPAGEGPYAHPGMPGQFRERERLVQVLERPFPGRRRDGHRRLGRGLLDELGLTAVAPGRYGAVPGGLVGDPAAVVVALEVQAQVDPRLRRVRRRRGRRCRSDPLPPRRRGVRHAPLPHPAGAYAATSPRRPGTSPASRPGSTTSRPRGTRSRPAAGRGCFRRRTSAFTAGSGDRLPIARYR
jgi:hypothetical protein